MEYRRGRMTQEYRRGEASRCEIRLELDHKVSLAYHLYDIQLFVPVEFASLLEVGRTVSVTLEQIRT
jgi:hypothetical protein